MRRTPDEPTSVASASDHFAAFRQWLGQSFAANTGRISGKEATVEILLPIAAVAFGMTIFGLVFHYAVPHAGY